jgi:uncharacterized protein
MTNRIRFAFDKKTARSFDDEGRMRVKDCVLSTAEINPYRGREIPGYEDKGLDANKVYELYRDPDEMKKSVASFEGVPLMIKHIVQTAAAPQNDYIGGSVYGIDFDGKHLRGSLLVMDGKAIDLIESGELADLSCGYLYDPVMRSGEANGVQYDGVMTNIRGNHVALVDDGRASGAHVADSALVESGCNPQSPDPSMQGDSKMPFPEKKEGMDDESAVETAQAGNAPPGSPEGEQNEQSNMAMIGQALKHIAGLLENIHGRMGGDSGPVDKDEVEQDPAVGEPGMPSHVNEDADLELDPAVGEGEEMSMDGDLDGEEPSGVPAEGSEADAPTFRPRQDGLGARGGPTPHAAMDARSVQRHVAKQVDLAVKAERQRVMRVDEARRDVRAVLGDAYGLDSAAGLYRAALEQVGVDLKAVPKGGERAAWTGFKAAQVAAAGIRHGIVPNSHAMDSGSIKATQDRISALLGKISVKG